MTAVGVVVVLYGGQRLEIEIRIRADSVEVRGHRYPGELNVFAPAFIATWTVTTCELET